MKESAQSGQSDQSAFERFEDALRKVLSVPKRDVEKAELRRKKEREARQRDAKRPT